jgi:histidyl-tRNA synthetase
MNIDNHIIKLIDELSKSVGLEKEKLKITPLNSIKILDDIINNNSLIINIFNKYYPLLKNNKKFIHLYSIITNKKYKEQLILGNNHYDNLLLNIYFVLNNPYLF